MKEDAARPRVYAESWGRCEDLKRPAHEVFADRCVVRRLPYDIISGRRVLSLWASRSWLRRRHGKPLRAQVALRSGF